MGKHSVLEFLEYLVHAALVTLSTLNSTVLLKGWHSPTVTISPTWTFLKHGEKSESESCVVVSDSLRPHELYNPWNSPGQNTGVDSGSLLQGIIPTQRWSPGLPTWQVDSLPAEAQGKPKNTEVDSLSLLQWSSQPRNRTRVSCIAGRFLINGAIRKAQWQVHRHDVTSSLKTYILWLFPFSAFLPFCFFSGFCARFSCFYPKVILSWSFLSVWARFLPGFLQIIHREILASCECTLVFTG